MILLLTAAFAAEPDTYALQGTVALPPTGPARIVLPPELVGGDPYQLATAVSIVGPDGTAVPYAVLLSSASPSLEEEQLAARPTSTTSWEIASADAPIDALRIGIRDLGFRGPIHAKVSWGNADHVEQLLYADGDDTGRTIPIPHVRGPFQLEVSSDWGAWPGQFGITGLHLAPEHVEPAVETVKAPAPILTETGSARYVLRLGGPRYVNTLRFRLPTSVDVLDRSVTITAPSGDNRYGTIRRVRVGEADIADLEVGVGGLLADTLTVDVALDRQAPPAIEAFEVVSEGAVLLVRDAGQGPHTLYAAGSEPGMAYDLSTAQSELLRSYPPLVPVTAIGPNPAYIPLPTREGLDQPGPDLRLDRFAFERDIVGATGWVRVPIGADILAHARADAQDLRVVDAEGHQLPFVLRQTGAEVDLPLGEPEREERGGLSRLRVTVPGNAPVATLTLVSPQKVFDREVTVRRDAGRVHTALRSVSWNGETSGGRIAVSLGERVGPALIVEIDNGDDAPLPIESIRATVAEWELRVRVPEGGARLVYGAPGESAPDHDLSMVANELDRVPLAEATPGEERALTPPTPGVVDRLAAVARSEEHTSEPPVTL